jgi:hypothetical protein
MIREFDTAGNPIVILENGVERRIASIGARSLRDVSLRYVISESMRAVRPPVPVETIYRKPALFIGTLSRGVDALQISPTPMPYEYTAGVVEATYAVASFSLTQALYYGVSRSMALGMLQTYHSTVPNEDSWHS